MAPDDRTAVAPSARAQAAREFFAQLRKGAKAISMYRHNPSRFAGLLQPSQSALEAALAEGPLVVKVAAESFAIDGQEVWSEQGAENVPFRFYREGVRQLVFRPGITAEELGKFVLVLLTNTERTGGEIVGQLWSAGFEHLDYVVVDGFRIGEMTDTEVHVEVDRLVDYLASRLRGSSDDTVAFARISAADLDLKLEGIEQVRGALFDGEAVTDAFKKRMQEALARDEREKLPNRVLALFELQLSAGTIDAAPALELLTQTVDAALLHEDLAPVKRVLDGLDKVASAAGPGQSLASEVRKNLAPRLADEARVRRLGEMLRQVPKLDPAGVARYLGALNAESVPTLLDVLDALEPGPARGPLVDALAKLAPERPQFLEARLEAATSQSARDLVAIVVRGTFPDAPRYLQAALRNPNPQVKLAVVAELGSAPKPELAHRFVLDATLDKLPAVRAAAFRALVQLSPARAVQDLLRLPKLPDWDKRDATERELIHTCIGLTQRPEALAFLQQPLLVKKSLLNAKKVAEAKRHAITGLQAMGSLPAFKLLQGVVDSQDDEEVLLAARKAMFVVKKALFEPVARPNTSSDVAAVDPSVSADALFNQFQKSQQAAAAETAQEKARVQAAIQARADAETAAQAKAAQEREEQMKRPFGLSQEQLASLQEPVPQRRFDTSPGAPRPLERPDTSPGASGAVRPPTSATQPRAAAPVRSDTSPGAPRPSAQPAVAAGDDDLAIDIDLGEDP